MSELSGWTVDDETIRQTTHAAANRARADRPERADSAPFAAAAGGIEAAIDAIMNTLDAGGM